MDKSGLFIGLGGVGKSSIDRIINNATKEKENPTFVVVDCSDDKKSDNIIVEIKSEEKADE